MFLGALLLIAVQFSLIGVVQLLKFSYLELFSREIGGRLISYAYSISAFVSFGVGFKFYLKKVSSN